MSDSSPTVPTSPTPPSPTTALPALNDARLKELRSFFASDPKLPSMAPLVGDGSVDRALLDRAKEAALRVLSAAMASKPRDPVRKQGKAGRCWVESGHSVVEGSLMKKEKCSPGKLSAKFVQHADYMEKGNARLSRMVNLLKALKGLDSEEMQELLAKAVEDGGSWERYIAINTKYGCCPEMAYPDNAVSTDTAGLRRELKELLARAGVDLAAQWKEDPDAIPSMVKRYQEMLYSFLSTCLGGAPPTGPFKLVGIRKEKEEKPLEIEGKTPQDLYDSLKPPSMLILCNSSAPDLMKPAARKKKCGPIPGYEAAVHYFVDESFLADAVTKATKEGGGVYSSVWWSLPHHEELAGESLFSRSNIGFGPMEHPDAWTRHARILAGSVRPTHATVAVDVETDQAGAAVAFCLKDSASGGSYKCVSANDFTYMCFSAVVPASVLSKADRAKLAALEVTPMAANESKVCNDVL